MKDSVSNHLVADVPVSAFLSGELDSSLISVLAKKQLKSLNTYTIGTNSKDKKIERMPADEKYAKKLAEQMEFNHNEIIIESNIIKILPKMVKSLDEPIGNPAAINTFMICDAAKEKGVKVLLSGMGADEIFFGYRRQKANLLVIKYNKLPSFFKILIKFIVNILPVKIFGKGLRISRWAKKFLSFTNLPNHEAYMMSYSYYNNNDLCKLTNNKYNNYINEITEEHKNIFEKKISRRCY